MIAGDDVGVGGVQRQLLARDDARAVLVEDADAQLASLPHHRVDEQRQRSAQREGIARRAAERPGDHGPQVIGRVERHEAVLAQVGGSLDRGGDDRHVVGLAIGGIGEAEPLAVECRIPAPDHAALRSALGAQRQKRLAERTGEPVPVAAGGELRKAESRLGVVEVHDRQVDPGVETRLDVVDLHVLRIVPVLGQHPHRRRPVQAEVRALAPTHGAPVRVVAAHPHHVHQTLLAEVPEQGVAFAGTVVQPRPHELPGAPGGAVVAHRPVQSVASLALGPPAEAHVDRPARGGAGIVHTGNVLGRKGPGRRIGRAARLVGVLERRKGVVPQLLGGHHTAGYRGGRTHLGSALRRHLLRLM